MTLEIIIIVLCVIIIALLTINLFMKKDNKLDNETKSEIKETILESHVSMSSKIISDISIQNQNFVNNLNEKIRELKTDNAEFMKTVFEQNNQSYKNTREVLDAGNEKTLNILKQSIFEFTKEINERLEKIDNTVEKKLNDIREDNTKKLDKIQGVVDEKLQNVLEKRLSESFNNVVEQLTLVNKTIGEIKGIANDVGSLKTVLTNVKTKGILGEVILSNLIKEILAPSQYEENIVTKKGSNDPVEFAIKLPGTEGTVYLPIDSKLPTEAYHRILDGISAGDKDAIENARKELKAAIKTFAKDISTKYIDVPNTTEFAIMFLPLEGLYAEVINMGLLEEIQKTYKVILTGPSTFAALLNSLQMGFKTLAIQKKSAEVFKLLGAIKTEFAKFADVLEKAKKKVSEAEKELETLSTTRTRMIQSKLRTIEELPEEEAKEMLE